MAHCRARAEAQGLEFNGLAGISGRVEEGVAILDCPNGFQAKQLMNGVLGEALSAWAVEYFGPGGTVSCAVSQERPLNKKQMDERAGNDPAVAAVVREFGARIVDTSRPGG